MVINDDMDTYSVLVDVYKKQELIDSFLYSIDDINPLSFPKKEPYQGMKLYITGSLNDGYAFSPDGYEMWIRFSTAKEGIWKPYLIDQEYTFIFIVVKQIGTTKEDKNVYDNIDEFDRIKKLKKEI